MGRGGLTGCSNYWILEIRDGNELRKFLKFLGWTLRKINLGREIFSLGLEV